MLELTVGEEVVIGNPGKPLGIIRVMEIHGEKVRLSFNFSRDMAINRKELADLKAKPAAEPGAIQPHDVKPVDPP